jgi:hypothetical protein
MNVGVKKVVSVFLLVLLSFSMVGVTSAAKKPVQSPDTSIGIFWTNTTLVSVNLSFDDGKGICGAYVLGKSGTTKITGTVVLARKNANGSLTPVKTWSGLSTTGDLLLFDGTYYVTTGHTYRLTITATVYRDGVGETVSGYYEAYAE